MDTEGLGSTSRSQTEDVNIFSLALLLSSYFIWNSRGVIDGNALEDFGLVVNITKHIHVRSNIVQNQNNTSLSEVEQLASYFPSFLWVVRDFALRLEEDGRPLTDRQYLEKALKPQGGFSEDAAARNQVRHLLGSFFPDRDCTTLVRPAEDEAVLRDLMRAPPGAIRPEFAGALRALKKKVFGAVRPKGLHGRLLSGPMVATLARAYVKGINSGGAPTISSAWERVLESQAEQAVAEALERYGREMARRLGCPLGARGRPDVAERVQEYQDMERAKKEAERAVAEREARCEGEQAVVQAQAEAAAAQLAQSRAFLEKLEAAHAAVAEVLNEQCSLTEQLAEELRETAAQMEAPPPSAAAAHENGDDDSDEEETTVWDVKAQVSASETEIRMLRQEIDLKEQHLEANMRLLDIKEKELREVEYQWGMTKASNAAEVDDMGEVEEEIDALYRIARGLKGYLSWTTPFGRLPLGLAAQLTPEQKAVLEEISAG